MSVWRPDPEHVRNDFWKNNKRFAPPNFKLDEDDRMHYTFVPGRTCISIGPTLIDALKCIWGTPSKQRFDLVGYEEYMSARMKKEDLKLAFDILSKCEPCQQVYGDCTFENIILTADLRIFFIDPGHPRGFVSPANDLGKLLQSQRGWEAVKKGGLPEKPVEFWDRIITASYWTHLHRLLKHKHSTWCLDWARHESKKVRDYLGA